MEIRLYAPPGDGFTPVAVTNAATRISYKESFFGFGDFEILIPAAAYNAGAFGKYLFALIDRSFWGVILAVERTLDSGGDMLSVTGLCADGLLSSRYTVPPGFSYEQVGGTAGYDVANGSTESCIKHFVEANFFQAGSPTRSVPGFAIAPDLGRGKPDDKYMTRFEPLSEVVETLCRESGLGYAITPDIAAGEIVFDCIEGADRTALQSVNPRVIFNVERGNIAQMDYQDSDRNMRNVFYASLSGSQYADDTYTATITRDDELAAGIYRWEQHLDISASHPTPGQELTELRRLALARADSYKTVNAFSAQVMDAHQHYGVDYFLGDTVTVQNRGWGLSMDTRITEMATEADGGGITRTATFGDAPINFADRLRRQIRGG